MSMCVCPKSHLRLLLRPKHFNKSVVVNYGIMAEEVASVYQQREYYTKLPLDERRKLYACESQFSTVDRIETWQDYFSLDRNNLKLQLAEYIKHKEIDIEGSFSPKEMLNRRVSLWLGDITTLEVDAIVINTDVTLRGRGEVEAAVKASAGPMLVQECEFLGLCNAGEARITGGYHLPARYVIHVVGPRTDDSDLLTSCYEAAYQMVKNEKIRTVAFPCIATGNFEFNREKAAIVALRATRFFIQVNKEDIDRIIFCVFNQKDRILYECFMQLFFPVL